MTAFPNDLGRPADASCLRVLARYLPRVVPDRVESLGNRGGFSGAGIWRVTTSQGDFALRRWPNPSLPRTRLLGLHRLLEHLRREGLSCVAVPLESNDGTTLVRDFDHDWQLEPWMPGIADFHSNPSPDRLRAAMATLAQWHLAAARFVPPDHAAQWFAGCGLSASPSVVERLNLLKGADEGSTHRMETRIRSTADRSTLELTKRILELFQRIRTRTMSELELVRDVRVSLHPCLRDVSHDHVLFVGDQVTGLIDPTASRTESVACDLSRLVGSLVSDDFTAWEIAIEEYHRHRPLTTGERALITVLNRSGVLLSGWIWLEWLYLERRPFSDAAAVQKRLTTIVQRMEHLADAEPSNRQLILL